MKSKKVFIIIFIILLISIIIIVCHNLNKNNKFKIKVEEVSKRNYFLVYDKKYGIINENGDVIVKENYDMIQIPNPSKDVFIVFSDYDSTKGSYKTKVVNKESQEILTEYEGVEAIQREESLDDIPYEKNVLKYKKDGKYGIIDFSGKKITKPIYDDIQALEYKEGMLLIKKNGKMGVISINGDELIKSEYDSIESDLFHTEGYDYGKSGFITSIKTKEGYRYGYINCDGKKLLKTEYNEIVRINYTKDSNQVYLVAFKDGRAGLLKNGKTILNHEYEDLEYDGANNIIITQKLGKQGVADINGNVIIPIEYENIIIPGKCINAQKNESVEVFDLKGNLLQNKDFISIIPTESNEYFVTIDRNENYGIIDKNDNIVFENKYTFIDYLNDNYFVAQNEKYLGVMNLEKKEIIEFKYDVLQKLEGTNIIEGFKGETLELINKKMQVIMTMENAFVEIKENYIVVYNKNERRYFDFEGNELLNTQVLKNINLFAKKENGKWGFEDKNKKTKIEYKYDMVTELNEQGFAGIKKDGKWGVINSNGEIIIEPTYEIEDVNPDFIGKYYKVDLGYGEIFYTNE